MSSNVTFVVLVVVVITISPNRVDSRCPLRHPGALDLRHGC